MRKILFGFLLVLLGGAVAFADELGDSLRPHLAIIYDQLAQDAEHAVQSCQALEQSLSSDVSRDEVKEKFQDVVLDWKRIQAMYVLSEYDDEMIDVPHYIDVFHRGNEDLGEQMARILASEDEAKTALFKNSHKTVNALERVIYASDLPSLSARELELSQYISANICTRLETVKDGYGASMSDFLAKPKKAVAVLLNELIDSSHKLKEWRLGEAAGVARKSDGKPNSKYLEYQLSGLSMPAAIVILEQHTTFTDKSGEFAKIIELLAEYDEIEEPMMALANARKYTAQAAEMMAPLTDADVVDAERIKPIYTALNRLNDSYFVELIDSLSDVVARILDSDGD